MSNLDRSSDYKAEKVAAHNRAYYRKRIVKDPGWKAERVARSREYRARVKAELAELRRRAQ